MMLLRTLLSHYRRHPVQAVFLVAGVTMANVLLVGTMLINAQARASYVQGEQWLKARPVATIQARSGAPSMEEREYFRLRRLGFDNLMPVLRRFERSAVGESLELLGIDVFALPRRTTVAGPSNDPRGELQTGFRSRTAFESDRAEVSFMFPPFQLLAAPARISQLGWVTGTRPKLASGLELPTLAAASGLGLGYRLLIDIGALQDLTDSRGEISQILVLDASPHRLDALRQALPVELEWTDTAVELDPGQLTRSFHLNLSAMGFMTFVVGLFLIYNALAFSYTDRRDTILKMRLNGVTRGELSRALLIELGLFVLAGTAFGFLLGAWLAARLLPGVGQTLAQLYGVYISYPDKWLIGGFALPLTMTALASGLCVLIPLRQVLYAPVLRRQSMQWDQRVVARRDRWLLSMGLVLLAIAAGLALSPGSLVMALACMAALLLGSALCLPAFLRAVLGRLSVLIPSRWCRSAWLVADCRWLLGPASLALMAMVLALVANSGLNTMIGSFRFATDNWLQQRLTAQLYLRGAVDVPKLETWLQSEAPDVHLAKRYRIPVTAVTPSQQKTAIEVVALPASERFTNAVVLMKGLPDAREKFRAGAGVFISERAWRLDGWNTGDYLTPCSTLARLPVLGIYRDYGNPQSQWLINTAEFNQCWPQRKPDSYALFSDKDYDWDDLRSRLSSQFGLDETRLINQQELMAAGLAVFDHTFTVTRALNALTLLVAGVGIFCAISAIHHHRIAQQAMLAVLGVSRRERAFMLMMQWGLLGLLCLALVWPIAVALAWVLSALVTPAAFGWSFALRPEWHHLPVLALTTVAALVLAIFLPSLRLLRISPAHLLREQTT
jgi:putative ABC transport system permease protein